MNRQVRLKSRPTGTPTPDNFEMAEAAMPEGDVVRRTLFLSLDPYMRGRMSDGPSYATPVAVGDPMCGHTVSQVVSSRNPDFRVGDFVTGYDGWQQFGASSGKDLRKLDPSLAPISTAIGVLGMPGMTAYVGLLDIGQPKAGETVVVSAASGAVGAVVGQLAKIKGCRAVGVAGSADKCRYVVEELGFDACINYGGAVQAAVFRVLNKGARIPLCGMISEYNATSNTPGPNLRPLLVNRAMIKGFIVSDHIDRAPAFFQEVAPLVKAGRIKFREDIVDGLENAPSAFIGLLEGKNFGKLIIRVAN